MGRAVIYDSRQINTAEIDLEAISQSLRGAVDIDKEAED